MTSLLGRSFACRAVLVLCLCPVGGLGAQEQDRPETPAQITLPAGESAQAYRAALRWRGIDRDVAYFDPERPSPDPELRRPPPEPGSAEGASARGAPLAERTQLLVFAVCVLLGIALLVVRMGGLRRLPFGPTADNVQAAGRTGPGQGDAGPQDRPDLAAIAAMRDRRVAIMALLHLALDRAGDANGVRLGRSWTARDALARVPSSWRYHAALRDLVMTAERVHFGGQALGEDAFQSHLAAARAMIGGR